MPLAALLNINDPLFDFEHMMAHRQYFAVMSHPLSHFSVLPYLLDPTYDLDLPATGWHLNHQQAHNDFNRDLPSNYADGYYLETVTPPPIPNPTPPPPTIQPPPYEQAHAVDGGTFGIPSGQNLVDTDLASSRSRSWWTFVNHQQHYIANNAILPLPTTNPTKAGTGPGEATLSNPWWWASRAPVRYPFW